MTAYARAIKRYSGLGTVTFSSMIALATFLLLAREMAAGAVRYYFDQIGMGVLWFLPDAMVMGLLFLRILDLLIRRAPFPAPMVWFLAVVSIPTLLSIVLYGSGIATFSGIKMLTPVIIMVIMPPYFLNSPRWLQACFLLLVISVIGILANQFTSFPWEGYSIEQFGIERDAVRTWWIEGESRYAGLSAVSASGAAVTMLLTILVARRTPSASLRFALYAISLYACYVTTSRTSVMALMVAACVDLWPWRLLRGIGPGRITLSVLACASFFLPVVSSLILIAMGLDLNFVPIGMPSFLQRVFNTWPSVLHMISDGGVVLAILGHGFGSIGSPAIYTGLYISPISAVDNFFIYIFYIYGAASIGFAFLILSCFRRLGRVDRPLAFAAVIFSATLSSEGMASLTALAAAVAIGYYFPSGDRREATSRRYLKRA